MTSEWLRVMLDEIARKQTEAAQAQAEAERRRQELAGHPGSTSPRNDAPG